MATQALNKPMPRLAETPLVGTLFTFQRDRLGLLLRFARECGEAGVAHFGPFPFYVFTSADLAQQVLVEHAADFDKGWVQRNAFRPAMGNGLLISEGEFWRGQRKQIAPAFQPRQITRYAEAMVACAEEAQAGWMEGATIDLAPAMMRVTLRVVGKVLFDAEMGSASDDLGAAITRAIQYTDYALVHLFPIPLGWPTPSNRRTRAALALIKQRIQAMIDERRAGAAERDDLLSILLRAQAEDGSRMSDAQVRDEAVTLFLAGHETTAVALSWAFYLLATHPEIYTRLQAEVDAVLGGRAPGYADLPRLPYTLQVLKETMRLYPPAYLVSRMALRDVPIGGYVIHQNETVLIPQYTIHRRADYFPEPERFDPDRFTPENEKRLPRYAYMPFGAGPRVCIGNHFALMEGHLILATLAQRVRFGLVPGQQIVPQPMVTLRQKYGCRMVVRRRDAAYAPARSP